jgi:hypothetical protein
VGNSSIAHGVILTLFCSTCAETAVGQPGAVELAWDAPVECPSRVAAEKATGALVGPMAVTYEAEIRLRRMGDEWVGTLRTPGALRELRAPTCREAAQALVVVLALAVNPNAAVSSDPLFDQDEPGARTSKPEPSGSPEPRASAPSRGAHSRAAERRNSGAAPKWRQPTGAGFSGTFRLIGNVGILPAPTAGPALGLHYGTASLATELAVLGLIPRSGALPGDPNRGGTFDWAAARVSGEASVPGLPWGALVVGVEVGRLAGRGYGVDFPATGQALWLGLLAGTRVRPFTTRVLGLELGAAAGMPLLRPSLGLEGVGIVHRPARVVGFADIGIVLL